MVGKEAQRSSAQNNVYRKGMLGHEEGSPLQDAVRTEPKLYFVLFIFFRLVAFMLFRASVFYIPYNPWKDDIHAFIVVLE